MKLLAIETSQEACSANLYIDGENHQLYKVAPREHSALILKMMDQVLVDSGTALSQLDAVAFGRGPGSFTGLRIASGVIQGVAYAVDLPVVPISSLAALAQQALAVSHDSQYAVAIDARMNEVYFGLYQNVNGLVSALVNDQVCSPNQLEPLQSGMRWYCVGNGWQCYADALMEVKGMNRVDDAICYPQAKSIAILAVDAFKRGYGVEAEQALPVYLRNKIV